MYCITIITVLKQQGEGHVVRTIFLTLIVINVAGIGGQQPQPNQQCLLLQIPKGGLKGNILSLLIWWDLEPLRDFC